VSVTTSRWGLASAIAFCPAAGVDPDGATPPGGQDEAMAKRIPDSTKHSLHWRLADRARERWPDLAEVRMRYRAGFAYVEGVLAAGPVIPLCRLRYLGSATTWGFAIYRASHDDYEDNFLPSGSPTGTAEEALDCACGLYLTNPTLWALDPRRINDGDH
jgi:hypothetical protein